VATDKPTQISVQPAGSSAKPDEQPEAAPDANASAATYTSSGKNTSSSSKSPNALYVNYLA
jgi:hypothetical protein